METNIIYFVHGTTYDNASKLCSGWKQVELNDLGKEQAANLGLVNKDIKEDLVFDKEFGLTGFMAGAVANGISHFSRFGDAYRRYWNKQFGVDNPNEKGTVNPAVLTLRKKD